MDGNFELLGPIDLLQLLAQGSKTGVFRVRQGEVYLERGRPIHASYINKEGPEALVSILALKQGEFSFWLGERAPLQTLDRPLDEYLLQSLRFIDAKIEVRLFDMVERKPDINLSQLKLSAQEVAVLRLTDHFVQVIELARKTRLPLEATLNTVGQLARLGFLQMKGRVPTTAVLGLVLVEGRGTEVWLDPLLVKAWQEHLGAFRQMNLRIGTRHLKLNLEVAAGLGAQVGLSAEGFMYHNLQAGKEALVWPAV